MTLKTYRSIFKWGDKREQKLDKGIINLIKSRFAFTNEDFEKKYLYGDDEVKLDYKCKLDDKIVDKFIQISGKENISKDDYSRASHAFGKYYTDILKLRKGEIITPPDLVIYPRNDEEIVEILIICNEEKIAITPFGGQSSVTRGMETQKGGISLNLTKHFDNIIQVNEINSTVKVQSGIFGPKLEDHLNSFKEGYTCGHFPQSFEYSTVGGWIAARGAGQASTGYGKIEDMVLAMKVITPGGVIETKDYPATAQAWDLNKIFIGSEGALGVITEATLKIRKYRPDNTSYGSFIFKDFESAVNAMRQIMQEGIGLPHLFRISDPEETDIAFKTSDFDNSLSDKFLKTIGYKEGNRCLMFVSIEGNKAYTKFVKSKIRKIARKNSSFYLGVKPVTNWLKQRYSSAYLRDPLMDIGIMTDTLETSVSWENLVPLWQSVRKYLRSRKKTVAMVHISHVYENGANLYFIFLSPMEKGNEMEDYVNYHKGIIDTIQANNGSLSHHHGIGRALSPWLRSEIGKESLELLQAIKKHLDPNGIMNPGCLGLY